MIWPFRRGPRPQHDSRWPLHLPVLTLDERNALTLLQIFSGLFVCGGTGSGKTSSTLSLVLLALARCQPAFLGLTVKVDEGPRLVKLLRRGGHQRVRHLKPGDGLGYDPIRVLSKFESPMVIAKLLSQLASLGDGANANGGERFWQDYLSLVFLIAVTATQLAGDCSLPAIAAFLANLPKSESNLGAKEVWDGSPVDACLKAAERNVRTPQQKRDFERVVSFVLHDWIHTPERTKYSLLPMIRIVLDSLMTGPVGEFTSCDTLDPVKALEDGDAWIVDYPTLLHQDSGRFLQLCLKVVFDRLALRRCDPDPRPAVLWQDEASHFLLPDHDLLVQSTARQARLIRVTAIQDFQLGFCAMGGGDKGKQQFLGLVNNAMTWVCHSNGDKETCDLLSDRIGKERQTLGGGNVQLGHVSLIDDLMGQPSQSSASFHEHWDYSFRPEWFGHLAKGGARNGWQAEAVVLQTGDGFAPHGRTWLLCRLNQVR